MNQNPEQITHDKIDEMLRQVGWKVQSKKKVDLPASKGIAVREYQTDVGLFFNYSMSVPFVLTFRLYNSDWFMIYKQNIIGRKKEKTSNKKPLKNSV